MIKNTVELDWPADHVGWIIQTRTNSFADPDNFQWFAVDGSSATNHVESTLDRANSAVYFRLVAP